MSSLCVPQAKQVRVHEKFKDLKENIYCWLVMFRFNGHYECVLVEEKVRCSHVRESERCVQKPSCPQQPPFEEFVENRSTFTNVYG